MQRIAKDAVSLHGQLETLVGKPRGPSLDPGDIRQVAPHTFTSGDFTKLVAEIVPLEAHTQHHIAACEVWNADRPKLNDLARQQQEAGRLNGEIAQAKAALDELRTKDRELVSQTNWAKTPTNVQLHDQIQAQTRAAQQKLVDLGSKLDPLSQTIRQLQSRLDTERSHARDLVYSEVETAVGGLWAAEIDVAQATIEEINGEEYAFEYSALKQWDAAMNRITNKWGPVWEAAVKAQKGPVFDVNYMSPWNESMALCCKDNLQSDTVNTLWSRERNVADNLLQTHDRLAEDLKKWAAFSSHDTWPAAGKPKDVTDYQSGRAVLGFSFEEWKHLVLDPQEDAGPPPDPDPRSLQGKKRLTFSFATDSAGQSTGFYRNPPAFWLTIGGARDRLDGTPALAIGSMQSFNFSGEQHVAFFNARYEWTHWTGHLPKDAEVFDLATKKPVADPSTTLPFRPVVLAFDPFRAQNGVSVMYASGADKAQWP